MRGLSIVNNDIVIENSDFVMLEDDILVSIERLFTTNLSEFFLNLEMGLDYSIIKKKGYKIDEIKQAITDCILQDERVLSVNDISINVVDRIAYIKFQFATENGALESEVIL